MGDATLGLRRIAGSLSLERVAQDGMRVRADAGAASFRKEPTLVEHRQAAQEQVEQLKRALSEDPGAKLRMQEAARARAARDRLTRIEKALAEMPAVAEVKRRNRDRKDKTGGEPRVSTTDPESRVMKMADGGFRPAYNVQLATDTETRVLLVRGTRPPASQGEGRGHRDLRVDGAEPLVRPGGTGARVRARPLPAVDPKAARRRAWRS